MSENPIEGDARLNADLGEPETWLETLLREARRRALKAAAIGDEPLAKRWRKVVAGLDQASAATMTSDKPGDTAGNGVTQSQGETAP
jgi:hypothetical protein